MCLVGTSRTYEEKHEPYIDERRKVFLLSRQTEAQCQISKPSQSPALQTDSQTANEWISDFTPREKVEITRNCVAISEDIKTHVVSTVVSALLEKDSENWKKGPEGKAWRAGGQMTMAEVVELFDRDLLHNLKSECGGLQTLLRNHCHIFQGKA